VRRSKTCRWLKIAVRDFWLRYSPAWITSRSTGAAKLNTKRLGVRQNYLPRSEQPNNGTQMQCRSFSNLDGILVRPRDREIPALFGTQNDSFGIWNGRNAGPMEEVDCPQSQPPSNNSKFTLLEAGPDGKLRANLASIEKQLAVTCGWQTSHFDHRL
jgi:hypothetical protein